MCHVFLIHLLYTWTNIPVFVLSAVFILSVQSGRGILLCCFSWCFCNFFSPQSRNIFFYMNLEVTVYVDSTLVMCKYYPHCTDNCSKIVLPVAIQPFEQSLDATININEVFLRRVDEKKSLFPNNNKVLRDNCLLLCFLCHRATLMYIQQLNDAWSTSLFKRHFGKTPCGK